MSNKTYQYKVYTKDGGYITTWNNVLSDFKYTQAINSLGSSVTILLGKTADSIYSGLTNWITESGVGVITEAGDDIIVSANSENQVGPGSDVDLRQRVDVYVFFGQSTNWITEAGINITTESGQDIVVDDGAPGGRRIYSGYISKYKAIYGGEEHIEVNVVSFGAELANYVLESGLSTTLAYNSQDPTAIFKDAMDKFVAAGGIVSYNTTSADLTNTKVSYTFKTAIYTDVVKKVLELCPTDWGFWLDQGANIIYLKPRPMLKSHVFHLGQHVQSLELVRDIEGLQNKVYFVGGDIGGSVNLFKKYSDPTSITAYGQGLNIHTDNRVKLDTSADVIANSQLARYKSPRYYSTVTIFSSVYDIESITVGQLVGFANFNNAVDRLEMQVVNISYEPDFVQLTLDTLLPSVSKRVEDINRNLREVQTMDNPVSPT